MSTTMYKFTDANNRTYGGFQWARGEWKETPGRGELCGPGWLHCFSSPELAELLIHSMCFHAPTRLWEVECKGERMNEGALESGFSKICLVREISRPLLSQAQRVRFAILCAMEVCKDQGWRKWASAWLAELDRSVLAARASVSMLRTLKSGVHTLALAPDLASAEESAMSAAAVNAAAVKIWSSSAARKAQKAAVNPIDFPALATRAIKEEVA